MSSVGEDLRRERELRGVSLEEIADETKIAIRFLDAIEADRLEVIPGEFYRRACLRAYARHLGLDDGRVVSTYQFRTAAKSPTFRSSAEQPGGGERFISAAASRWIALAVLVLVVSGATFAVWPGRESPRPSSPVFPSSAEPVRASTGVEHAGNVVSDPVPRDLASADPLVREVLEESPRHGAALRMTFRVDESCWLEIRADDSLVAQGLMHRGFEKEVQADREIRLWLGNAAGVSLWVNEHPAKPLGRPGQVRKDLRITPENFTEFLVAEEEADIARIPTEAR